MSQIEIEAIPCLKDNYAYLIASADSADAYVVDPSEAEPIVAALQRRELTLRGILATHHHNRSRGRHRRSGGARRRRHDLRRRSRARSGGASPIRPPSSKPTPGSSRRRVSRCSVGR